MKTSFTGKQAVVTAVTVAAVAGGAAVAIPSFAADGNNTSPSASSTATPGSTGESGSAAQSEKDSDKAQEAPFSGSLQKLVDAGTITSEQATAIQEQFSQDRPERGEDGGGGGRHGGMGHGMRGGEALTAAAQALNMSEDDLRTKLQSQSLGQVADAAGVERDTLTAAMKKAMTEEFSSTIDERLTQMLDRTPGEGGPRGDRSGDQQGDQKDRQQGAQDGQQGGRQGQRGGGQRQSQGAERGSDSTSGPGTQAPTGGSTSGIGNA